GTGSSSLTRGVMPRARGKASRPLRCDNDLAWLDGAPRPRAMVPGTMGGLRAVAFNTGRSAARCVLTLTLALGASCAGGQRSPKARPRGRRVEGADQRPAGRPVNSVGEVTARCSGSLATDVTGCRRELQDQACLLGANIVWGVTQRQTEDGLE